MNEEGRALAGTELLLMDGDLAARMVAGIDSHLTRQLCDSVDARTVHWRRDNSSPGDYERSVEANRLRFTRLLGLGGARPERTCDLPPVTLQSAEIGAGQGYRVFSVQWDALPGAPGKGLLLQPDEEPVADIIALPDCDATPEMLVGLTPGVPEPAQFARRLAENGCRVIVPLLIDRRDTYSGIPGIRMTNQPHREFIYRAAYEMGRTMIGLEVEKILAAVDWLAHNGENPCGVIGYGEGGLIAFYAAAVDRRIQAAVVSGYFQPREGLWSEPIYRNVFGLLTEFGDAEIASLIIPRRLVVEACQHPAIEGPPQTPGRSGAAPGRLATPAPELVEAELDRARRLVGQFADRLHLQQSESAGSDEALSALLGALGATEKLTVMGNAPMAHATLPDPEARLARQFREMVEYIQRLVEEAPARRAEFWSGADGSSVEKWKESTTRYRAAFLNEVIGRLPPIQEPLRPRSRLVYDTPHFRGYEVVLDVFPDVFAYGILLVPKDLRDGEQRPVVVCQHGLEGRPQAVADPATDSPSYHRFACRLAEEGYVTYAPQNPYIGGDSFRVLVRKAQPLKQTLFSYILRQNERTLEWLSGLPFVDSERIGFYGLSYGGKTAMRIPAVLEGYALSICSADYNEWIWKTTSITRPYSYLITGEYDMPEWNLGNTFNYAEMSWLICPRPFMVERGEQDPVAPTEWVRREFARTNQRYESLGIGDRAELEVFDGPHTIHGVGTFRFLRRHLHPPGPRVKLTE